MAWCWGRRITASHASLEKLRAVLAPHQIFQLVAHQSEDCRLRDDQVAIALEGDLDRRLAEKQRVVAGSCLHRYEARLARRHSPRLLDVRIGTRHRKPGTRRDDGAALHRLIVDSGRWEVETDVRALLSFFEAHKHSVADDE